MKFLEVFLFLLYFTRTSFQDGNFTCNEHQKPSTSPRESIIENVILQVLELSWEEPKRLTIF